MNIELKKEIQNCHICGKEINNEIIVRINNVSICYNCTESIVDAVDCCAEDTLEIDVNQLYSETKKNKKTKTKRVTKEYNVAKVVEKVRKSVKGQDELVKKVSYTLLKNQKYPNRKSNILIVGNSGVGKTQTITSVLQILDIPYAMEDITSYSETGYIGRNVDELLLGMCAKYNFNKEEIERGVLVIDEFDKLARSDGACKDVSGLGVQKSLLKILEGINVNVPIDAFGSTIQIDTSKITFILLGVFPGIEKIRDKRLRNCCSNEIGFIKTEEKKETYINSNYIAEDFEKSGFMTEIIGRIKVFLEANELTENDFFEILTKSNLSSLFEIRQEFKERNIRLIIKQGTLELVAKKAISYKVGARAINTVLEDIFSEVFYELNSNPKKVFKTCIITPKILEDKTSYFLK